MNVGHLNFFKVNKCGLYKVNDDNTYGLELSETFDLIQDWVGTNLLHSRYHGIQKKNQTDQSVIARIFIRMKILVIS